MQKHVTRSIFLAICLTIIFSKHVYSKSLEDEEIFYDSLEYLSCCVEAEAKNQGYLGKVYVADCILNRFERGNYSNYFELINEKGQFACVSNNSIMCEPSEETIRVVCSELVKRTNTEIIYFRTNKYHTFGTPCFQYKDHYFSK